MRTRNLYTKTIFFAKSKPEANKFFGNWVRSEGKKGVYVVDSRKSKDGYEIDFIRKRKK